MISDHPETPASLGGSKTRAKVSQQSTIMKRAEKMVEGVTKLNTRQSFRIGRFVKFLTEQNLICEFNAWDRAQDVKEGRIRA